MRNYYVLKKIKEEDLPIRDMFSSFDYYVGTCQLQERVANGDIYICTDGSEIIEEEIRIDLYED